MSTTMTALLEGSMVIGSGFASMVTRFRSVEGALTARLVNSVYTQPSTVFSTLARLPRRLVASEAWREGGSLGEGGDRLVRRSGVLWPALKYQPHVHAHAAIRHPSRPLCSAKVIKPALLTNCPLSLYLKLIGTTTYASAPVTSTWRGLSKVTNASDMPFFFPIRV